MEPEQRDLDQQPAPDQQEPGVRRRGRPRSGGLIEPGDGRLHRVGPEAQRGELERHPYLGRLPRGDRAEARQGEQVGGVLALAQRDGRRRVLQGQGARVGEGQDQLPGGSSAEPRAQRPATVDLRTDLQLARARVRDRGSGRVAGELDREVVDLAALRAERVQHAGAGLGGLGEGGPTGEGAVGRRGRGDAAGVVAVGVAVECVVAAGGDLHGRAGGPAAQLHESLRADLADRRGGDELLRLGGCGRRGCGGGRRVRRASDQRHDEGQRPAHEEARRYSTGRRASHDTSVLGVAARAAASGCRTRGRAGVGGEGRERGAGRADRRLDCLRRTTS